MSGSVQAWRTRAFALLSGLALLALSSGVLAAAEVWVTGTSGTIEVGADGTVESFKLSGSVGDEIDRVLERRIREWRFEPVVENGQPVPVQARVELTLHAIPAGKGDMAVQIVDAKFFESREGDGGRGAPPAPKSHLPPPYYPKKAAAAGVMANASMVVTVDREGRPVSDVVESLDLRTAAFVRANDADKYARQFEAAIRSAMKDWKVVTDDLAFTDGTARVRIPVNFYLSGRTWGRLQAVVRPGQQDQGAGADAITDMSAGGAQASKRIALLTQLDPRADT